MITKQNTHIFLRLSIALAIIAALFKVMHWQYSDILLIVAVVGITLFYSIWFYKKSTKIGLDYAKFFLLSSFIFQYLFKILHLKYGFIFSHLFRISLVVFIIVYVKDIFFSENVSSELEEKQPTSKKKIYSIILNTITVLCIIIGAQFKILHWEFGWINGNILLTVGLVTATISIIFGIKKS
ncbi:GldL-related protein [Maribacter aquivivus]|uniref:GldL-related protein n=1 Tax=Maribacter aquivivus TaxID=228958 RepID=UPI0024915676|nr:hypothetical protein [Maribacter aquivivus]